MDQQLLEEFRQRLIQMQEEIQAMDESAKDSTRPVELDQTRVGRLSRMDAMQGQQMAKESERRRHLRLRLIQVALMRIEDDEFGMCIICEDEIDVRRLELDPSIPICITCADNQ